MNRAGSKQHPGETKKRVPRGAAFIGRQSHGAEPSFPPKDGLPEILGGGNNKVIIAVDVALSDGTGYRISVGVATHDIYEFFFYPGGAAEFNAYR